MKMHANVHAAQQNPESGAPACDAGRLLRFRRIYLCLSLLWVVAPSVLMAEALPPGRGQLSRTIQSEPGSSTSPLARTADAHAKNLASGKNSPSTDDPVYEAWEAFLQRRAADPAFAEGLSQESDDRNGLVDSEQSVVARGSLASGGWGTIALTLFGGMGLAGAYFVRKHAPRISNWIGSRGGGTGERHKVKVLSVSPVSQHGSVAVVSVCGEMLVLGVTSSHVSLLTRLGGPERHSAERPAEAPPRSVQRGIDEPSSSTAGSREKPRGFDSFLETLIKNAGPVGEASAAGSPLPAAGPIAAYAAHGGRKMEPPPEDMAGQVLRKMRTMKRFRA